MDNNTASGLQETKCDCCNVGNRSGLRTRSRDYHRVADGTSHANRGRPESRHRKAVLYDDRGRLERWKDQYDHGRGDRGGGGMEGGCKRFLSTQWAA